MSAIKKILAGYGKAFRSTGFILLLILCCTAVSALFVYPLWKLAETDSRLYTITAFALLGAFLVWKITAKTITYLSPEGITPGQRKVRLRRLLVKTAAVFGFAAAAILFIVCVMNGKRLAGIIIAAAAFVIYGIAVYGMDKPAS